MQRARLLVASLIVTWIVASIPTLSAAEFKLEQYADGVHVLLDGKPFTDYLIHTGPKPILWPIIGPTGVEMTRDYPMKEVANEKHDHPHQRSLWFTYGEVNGLD